MKKIIPFLFIAVLWALSLLMPTHDDWTYLTSPHWGNILPSLYPHANFWRPFDVFFGWILGTNVKLFPFLNHLFILLAHCGTAFLLYKITLRFKLSSVASSICVLYFLFSPGMLGTVLGIDSLNQAYATFWGICSLYFFITYQGAARIAGWIICALMAVFSKENGIVWLFIPPFLYLLLNDSAAYRKKGWLKYVGIGLLVAACYFCIRKSIEVGTMELGGEDSPYHLSLKNKITDFIAYLSGSFLAVDFISVLHKPSRNLAWAAFTFAANLPFLFLLLKNAFLQRKERYIWFLLLSSVFAALPHLVTHFGPMHSYACLALNALLIGLIVNRIENVRRLKMAFLLFLVSALFVDAHHWWCTYQSSRQGIEMARKVVHASGTPEKALVITVLDDEPRYSSFCVPPREAYQKGEAVRFVYEYKYPREIIYKELQEADRDSVPILLNEYKDRYDCAWINYKDSVQVVIF